jgi:DNA-directed RNA polymerase subunit F
MVEEFEILKEEIVPLSRVKEILSKKAPKDLTYEQKKALDHAKEFIKLNDNEIKNLMEELKALEIRKLKDKQIIKILDILPKNIEQLKVILTETDLTFKTSELEKIMQVVKKYVKTKK